MNDDLDIFDRVTAYHDHIAAPPVPVIDDLRRGRSRVRRNRGLLAGGVAVSLASVVAAVTLAAGGSTPDPIEPAEAPAPQVGLTTPLVLPESPFEIDELGFHVEPAPGVVPNAAWRLAPDHQSTTVDWAGRKLVIRVYYPGTERPAWQLNLDGHVIEGADVHGVRGSYVEQFGKGLPSGRIDFSREACGTPPRGCDIWQSELLWEFAPGSWASVYGIDGESPPEQAGIRAAFIEIAEAVTSGDGLSTRLPLRVGSGLGPLPPPQESGVGLAAVDYPPGTTGWLVSFYGEPTLQLSASDSGSACDAGAQEPDQTVEAFTYEGQPGCVFFYRGDASGVALRVDGVDRVMANPWGRYRQDGLTAEHIADLKQWLADLTTAPLDDPTTWFDLETALLGEGLDDDPSSADHD